MNGREMITKERTGMITAKGGGLVVRVTKDWLATVTKAHTRRAYQTGLTQFAAWLGNEVVGDPWGLDDLPVNVGDFVSARTLKRYAKRLLDGGKKRSTVNHRLSCIRKWVRALEDNELIHPNRAEAIYHVKGLKGKNRSYRSHLGQDEVQAVIDKIGTERLIDKRDRVLIATLYWTGLRRSELCALTVGQVKETNGYIILDEVDRKGGGMDFVKLQVPLVRALREWLELAGLSEPGDPLFCGVSKGGAPSGKPLSSNAVYLIVQRRCSAAGFEGITPHALRRSGATNQATAGAPSNVIQSWGAWKGRSMLDVYVQQTKSLDVNGSDFLHLAL